MIEDPAYSVAPAPKQTEITELKNLLYEFSSRNSELIGELSALFEPIIQLSPKSNEKDASVCPDPVTQMGRDLSVLVDRLDSSNKKLEELIQGCQL